MLQKKNNVPTLLQKCSNEKYDNISIHLNMLQFLQKMKLDDVHALFLNVLKIDATMDHTIDVHD